MQSPQIAPLEWFIVGEHPKLGLAVVIVVTPSGRLHWCRLSTLLNLAEKSKGVPTFKDLAKFPDRVWLFRDEEAARLAIEKGRLVNPDMAYEARVEKLNLGNAGTQPKQERE